MIQALQILVLVMLGFASELAIVLIIDLVKSKSYIESGPISIKMVKVGNRSFHLRIIENIQGIESFSKLRGQVFAFHDITVSITDKITQYKLEDYYARQKRWQSDIDFFCDKIEDLGTILNEFDPKEYYTDHTLRLIVKEIIKSNRSILLYFLGVAQEIDETIAKKEECK